jgi:hypothetical protein
VPAALSDSLTRTPASGFGYVMNRMGLYPFSDPRELALRQALFRDALRTRPQR